MSIEKPCAHRKKSPSSDAQVSGVPSLMVNGKFMTSASLAGGNEGMIRVISQLAEQEHKAS